jgi:phosphoribosyl 1,2-cyclic phosphodiesterase
VLLIESNHDVEMLRTGPYPWSAKQRIMSRVGHLSNDALAEFFSNDYDGGAEYIILAHLSEENNHPERARIAAEQALAGRQGLWQNHVLLATQTQVLESIRL